jgi:transposase
MGRAIALRENFDGPTLRQPAKVFKDTGQSQQFLALAEVYDGGGRTDVTQAGAVGLQVVRDWVLRFNADGLDGLIYGKAPTSRRSLMIPSTKRLRGLLRVTDLSNPRCGALALQDLALWLFGEFRTSLEESSVAAARHLSRHDATPRPCSCILLKFRPRSRRVPTSC